MNRTAFEILAKMLEISREEATKTKLTYKIMTSQKMANTYLDLLTSNGLLRYNEGNRKYKTTEKGERYIRIYRDMVDMVPSVLKLDNVD